MLNNHRRSPTRRCKTPANPMPAPRIAAPAAAAAQRVGQAIARANLLLARLEALNQSAQTHRKLSGDLEAQEQALLQQADLNDARQLQTLAGLRLRRQCLPQKLENLSGQTDAVWSELREVCLEFRDALVAALNEKIRAARDQIQAALGPFFSDRRNDAAGAARAILNETNFGRKIARTGNWLKYSTSVFDRPQLWVIQELMRHARLVGEADACCPDTVVHPPRLISSEELERQELAELLANPEPHLAERLRYLDCAAAEAAVESRKKFLLEKYPESVAAV